MCIRDRLSSGEFQKLSNVGAGNEGLAADAAKDCYTDVLVAAELRARSCQAFIHLPGHGVACLRPIEQNCRHRTFAHQSHFTVAHLFDAPSLLLSSIIRATWRDVT